MNPNESIFPWEGRILIAMNLHFEVTPTKLRDFLISKGKILRVDVERDRQGGANGIAFIEFNSAADAESALQLNGQQFGGRKFMCKISDHPPPELVRYYIRDPMNRPISDKIRQRIIDEAMNGSHERRQIEKTVSGNDGNGFDYNDGNK